MTFASAIHDPLALNLRRQTRLLFDYIPRTSPHHDVLSNASTTRELLTAISSVLAVPAFTKTVATLFRPILVDLCARWLETTEEAEDHLFALCYLVEVHEELFSVLNKFLSNFFEEGPLSFVTQAPSLTSIDVTHLLRHLFAYYRILQANRELPRHLLWSLTPLSKLIWTPHLDNGVRLLAIRCYSLQTGMAEAERLKIEREVLGEPCGVDCQLNYGQNLDGTEKEVDGWIMPVVESRRVREEREEIATQPVDFYSREATDAMPFIQDDELCPYIANVHGVLLLRTSTVPAPNLSLIPTPSSIEGLRQLALHVSLRLPTLLTSTPSAGKALLLSHLAVLLHPEKQNQVVTIRLADTSLDPRSLLGSYISSSVQPGTFEWKEGVLVRSMREGKWVVFEDVDRGSNEVLGVLKPLVESLELGKWIGGRARLSVPSQGTVIAHDQFMLFATRSTSSSSNGSFHPPTFFGSHKFSEIIICSPSKEELCLIINAKFPRLAGNAAHTIIQMWDAVMQIGTPASARDVGLRELQKFCQRIESLLPASYQAMDIASDDSSILSFPAIFPHPSLREEMYLEARDVFFGAGTPTAATRAHFQAVAELIGEHLGLEADRQKWVLGKPPAFDIAKDANGRVVAVSFGRTRVPARSSRAKNLSTPARPFAMHKPALALLSRISNAVSHVEPVLLTGETGTGKTSVISHLASMLNRELISLNLSHQTESSDLIGGLKPIDARIPGFELQESFLILFGSTFSRRKNEKFETEVRKAVNDCNWKRAVGLWKESVRLAMERIQAREAEDDRSRIPGDEIPRKRRKTERSEPKASASSWSSFLHRVEEFEVQHVHGKGKFAFGFVEGPLVKALRSGDWILLDELNLASPETLECISGLLYGPTASITLSEHGSLEPVPRHPNFRLFACMNPATDVGKKDLPPTIRSHFTEIDVPPPDADKDTLLSIITQYIGHVAVGDKRIIMDIAEFYTAVKQVAEKRQIADGANHRPNFSMRTLARALTFASDTASTYSLRRSVWEGSLMAFTMVLDSESAEVVTELAKKHLLANVSNARSVLKKEPPAPAEGKFVKFGPFYLQRGPLEEDMADDYVITPSVEQKLIDLSRIILTRRFPVLIEGPTSSGKTSAIEYLAKRTGHRFVRINNHEHTDIQEYLGSYVSDPLTGQLVFKDGLLVQALRQGHWIVLDELNLAPTDVLEALNRLLDDNRELVIPETQEVIRPHDHFMLFATQNPPGLYAGRKVLSRAFRNRFLEVHFEDVPQSELETILCQRCRIAPSYGKRIVNVFHELQKHRQTGRIFESKHGFATLRDLFRWAGRDAVGYQELADNGYMLLAERARRLEDKLVVKEVIESVMGVRIDEDAMYDLHRMDIGAEGLLGHPAPSSTNTVWTKAMQRLYTLVSRGLKFNEPILLVGETGSGKTSVCQVFADSTSQRLVTLNCHQNTETADLIGGLRPVRNHSALQAEAIHDATLALKDAGINPVSLSTDGLGTAVSAALKGSSVDILIRQRLEEARHKLTRLNSIFEWHDGPLINAMNSGAVFLLDEISLADDSVLERLNSVLEPGRSVVLAERGGTDSENPSIRAVDDFKLIATMNPGGDYGKKELSPALRNRFTEIWVPSVDNRADLELIVNSSWKQVALRSYTSYVLLFVEWFCTRVDDRSLISLRDILAWVHFINSAFAPDETDSISSDELFHHGAHMTYLDGLGSLPQLAGYHRDALQQLKVDILRKLQQLVPLTDPLGTNVPAYSPVDYAQLGSFAIRKGRRPLTRQPFNFAAPTTLDNAMRVIRACQVNKPILLEGSPGVGKTSLITALANLSGYDLCRINLSDQTDLIDLFGSDLPVEGGAPGAFAWKDAEFLKALQEGHWVLLDEMNLAPQAVLEGLNAILDHRGTVYIPELDRSFKRHPSFRIFAAQNPTHQGGGRKGLPKSFVNRFTKVYIEELTSGDLYTVCSQIFPDLEENTLRAMISFNIQLNEKASVQRTFAREGAPWEFNLRDIIRWATLSSSFGSTCPPHDFLQSVYLHRFRSVQDRDYAEAIFNVTFSTKASGPHGPPPWTIAADGLQVGQYTTGRRDKGTNSHPRRILKGQLASLETLGVCVSQTWLAILTGPKDSGKTGLVRALADITGNFLLEVPINHASDTMDILGSFEQVNYRMRLLTLINSVVEALELDLPSLSGSQLCSDYLYQALSVRSSSERAPTLQLQALAKKTFDLTHALLSESSVSRDYQSIHGQLEWLLSSPIGASRFEWVDGPLVKAMKSGDWVLLDGANLCSPSVLDRLNSLCETDGFLTLSERGFVDGKAQVIKPHPQFRLFMSVDPHFGELSRAMRNRGIEVALSENAIADDFSIISDHNRLPLSPSPSLTSTSSRSAQGIFFDAIRRGIREPEYLGSFGATSTGRSFDQDSALSHLVDQAPSILRPSLFIENPSSWIFFFAQTLIPQYMPHLHRLIMSENHDETVRAFLLAHPSQEMNIVLQGYRQAYVLHKQTPTAFIYAQPMNFFWIEGMQVANEQGINVNKTFAHSMIFEILNLHAAIFVCENDALAHAIDQQRPLDEKHQLIRLAAVNIIRELSSTSRAILGTLEKSSPAPAKQASTLLSYIPHLRRALSSSSYDFSSLYAISEWLLDAMQNSHALFSNILESARTLQRTVSLSRGQGLFAVWPTFFLEEVSVGLRETAAWTERMSSSLKSSSDFPVLRTQAFNVLSLETIPSSLISLGKDLQSLLELRSTLNNCLNDRISDTGTKNLCHVEPQHSILELHILSLSRRLSKPMASRDQNVVEGVRNSLHYLVMMMQEIIALISNDQQTSLLRSITFQHLVWAQACHTENDSPLFARAQISWIEGLWNTEIDRQPIFGPSILFHAIGLHKDIAACDMNPVRLSSLVKQETAIRQQARLAIIECRQEVERSMELKRVFLSTLAIISSSYSSTFDKATYAAVNSICFGGGESFSESLFRALSLLQSSSDESFATTIESTMLRTLRFASSPNTMQLVGLAWTAMSRLLLALVVPDSPVDPAAVKNASLRRMENEQADLRIQIDLHQQLEFLVTGNLENETTRYLRPRLEEIRSRLAESPTLPQRHDISRLHLFWSEVQQFQKNVLSDVKVDSLLNDLLHGGGESYLRESVLQESLSGFYQRLDTLYPEFSDISILLKLAILHMRLGLRIISDSSAPVDIDLVATTLGTSVLSFPSLNSSTQIIRNFKSVEPSGPSLSRPVILALAALTAEQSWGIRTPESLATMEWAYEQAMRLWLIDRAREKQRLDESNTLYRRTKSDHDAISDAQVEEEEFLALFPTFEDALDAATSHAEEKGPLTHIQTADATALLHMHFALMEPSNAFGGKVDPSIIFQHLRKTTIRELSANSPKALPAALDLSAAPFRLSFLRDGVRNLTFVVADASYNFYIGENFQELKKGATVVVSLRQRLQNISEQWPDQMVLKHLIERCDAILNISSTSPVAKILTLVEQLLVQTDDWEMYANRDNSLKSSRDDLVRLIVDWRRLELTCWQTLLDSQATAFTDELGEWWFRLYDAVIRGPLSSVDQLQEDEDEVQGAQNYLNSLIPLLDDFIKTSPLGQFHSRMRLVQSFERYIPLISPSKTTTQKLILGSVGRVLHSTHSYYDLFSEPLGKYLTTQKANLEKETKAFIKLASWKDVNVQALQQSAKKTHHQLYKIVKKFRDILRQPVLDRIQSCAAEESESQPLDLNPPAEVAAVIPPGSSFKYHALAFTGQNHLIHLQRTQVRFAALISTQIRPSIRRTSAQVLDDTAVEIITTSKSLASLVAPSTLLGDLRDKHQKALLVRKRKAWSNLLKELKLAGLPSNVKPDVLRQNGSQLWVRDQPVMPQSDHGIDISKSEGYFVRLSGALPLLKSSIPHHHADLTTRELQRGEMFLEAGFSMAVDLRARLAVALKLSSQLSGTLQRLKALSVEDSLSMGSNLHEHLASIAELFCKTSHSLLEVRSTAMDANELGLNPPAPGGFLEEVLNVANKTSELHDQLVHILDDLNLTVLPCMNDVEQHILQNANEHISSLHGSVLKWQMHYPTADFVLRPFREWFQHQTLIPLTPSISAPNSDTSKLELVINSLLVCAQSLAARCPVDASDNTEEEQYVLKGHQFAREFTHLLNLGNITSQVEDLLSALSSSSNFQESLVTIIPFLDLYLSLVKEQLAAHSNWTKSLFKLDFVLCSLLQTLCQQGFCKPPDGEEGEAGGDASEATGGVGIGEGSGKENVSKEIEEESQIEGLKGDEPENKDQQSKEDGGAIEMEDDFGGALEDVSGAGSEEERESDAEEDADVDETLGDLDNLDPSAVDEKLWGDEKGPEDSANNDDTTAQDHSKEQGGQSEVVAKESKQQERSKEVAEREKTEDGDGDEHEGDDEMRDEEDGGNEEADDPKVSGAPMEEHVQDANTLDLPDEMDLGGDDHEKDLKEDGMEDGLEDEEDGMEDKGINDDSQDDFPMDEPVLDPPTGVHEPEEQDDDEAGNAHAEPGKEGDTEEEGHEEPREDIVAQPDLGKGDGAVDPNEVANPESGDRGSTGEVGTSQGGTGRDTAAQEKTAHDEGAMEIDQPSETIPAEESGSGSGASGVQQGQAPSHGEAQPLSNPIRSLGDALQEIRQRFDEILNSEPKDVPRQQVGDSSTQSQVEYLRPEDTDHEMQALGPAGEEQVAKLNQLNIVDDLQPDDRTLTMDVDQSLAPERHEKHSQPQFGRPEEENGVEQREGAEGAVLRSSLYPTQDSILETGPKGNVREDDFREDNEEDAELELKAWRSAHYPEDGAEHIWRMYASLTHDLAYALCEQLRLILEPTLATRLKGDYRTGKRLNMKKVIAYIASDYTKDKIWLRRTKPSQREYQVLISIDDSRSMAESHSIHLAYQTLALISKALSRLESGDIAIAKFGETVDLLHGFDEGPFTDQAGTKVVKAFKFNQKATNVLSLLDASLRVLENARERKAMSSVSAADLWQLQIIVSDGMCQDHDKLRSVLRRAEEQRVMVVFIILDSLQSASSQTGASANAHHQSILSMDKAEFKNVDGKMELQLQKYLDSFPFEYYVVLRNVEALPEVLAGTLKQFFERISEE